MIKFLRDVIIIVVATIAIFSLYNKELYIINVNPNLNLLEFITMIQTILVIVVFWFFVSIFSFLFKLIFK